MLLAAEVYVVFDVLLLLSPSNLIVYCFFQNNPRPFQEGHKNLKTFSLTFLKKSTTMVIPLLIGLALVGMSHGESGELFTMREAHQLKVLAKELVDRQKIGDLLTK